MESAIYGIVVGLAIVFVILGGYFWYLTLGKNDRLELAGERRNFFG